MSKKSFPQVWVVQQSSSGEVCVVAASNDDSVVKDVYHRIWKNGERGDLPGKWESGTLIDVISKDEKFR